MDLFKQEMKGPSRPAPGVPKSAVNRYSPVTNWNDDPFGADLFEPAPCVQKKMPPPRPPPPKVNNKQPDVPVKPSYFVRRPTVLTSLLSRKKISGNNHVNQQTFLNDLSNENDTSKVFPKCEPKNIQTGTLIDFTSPPSSPTFTTRSSSDGLSVDSFGSDATNSTNNHNANNGGNASQAESGFEDDFDLFLNTRKHVTKDDTFDDLATIDPFSPQPFVNKPPIMKKPVLNKDLFEMQTSNQPKTILKGPTIIRAKPARPKPPDNSALLKTTFGTNFPVTSMTINTTSPIQKISNVFGDSYDSKPLSWDSSPERESPPMPSVPPPPPPPGADEDLPVEWPEDIADFSPDSNFDAETEKPHAIALFDYYTEHPDDLCFSANTSINLIRRVDNEWFYGSVPSGAEGLFPCSYVEVRAPLLDTSGVAVASPPPPSCPSATALYDFAPAQPGDLPFRAGNTITVLQKISDEWYYGECNGVKGQFPVNYVQLS